MYEENDTLFLEHYGIKGQKWGERRYQNPDGSYTELGKSRRRVGYTTDSNAGEEKISGKAYKDMTRKERRAARKRARHNEKERREQRIFNRDKKESIQEGDLDFISKNISKYTNEEINEAVVRWKTMQSLKELNETEKNKKLNNFIDKSLYYLDKADKGTKSFTNIINSLNDMSKKSAERKQSQVDLEKKRVSLEKDKTDLQYFKDPKSKPLTAKEELELERAKKEFEWLKDPTKKPMSEKEKLELDWLKDPKTKPKTRKEEIEEEKAEEELLWFHDPTLKPLSWKEKYDLEKQKQEIEKTKANIRQINETAAKMAQETLINNEKLREERLARDEKEIERDTLKEAYVRMRKELEVAEDQTDRARKQWQEAKSKNDPDADYYEKEYDYYKARERDVRNQTDTAKDDYRKADKAFEDAKDKVKDTEDAIKDAKKKADKANKAAVDAEKNLDKQQKDYDKTIAERNFYTERPHEYTDGLERFGSSSKKSSNSGEIDPKEAENIANKYIKKLKLEPQKIGYTLDKKGNVTSTDARDMKWKKEIKKDAGNSYLIDKWVDEMKKKYIKEHGLSPEEAEKKAENYVDYWIDLYDDDKIV